MPETSTTFAAAPYLCELTPDGEGIDAGGFRLFLEEVALGEGRWSISDHGFGRVDSWGGPELGNGAPGAHSNVMARVAMRLPAALAQLRDGGMTGPPRDATEAANRARLAWAKRAAIGRVP